MCGVSGGSVGCCLVGTACVPAYNRSSVAKRFKRRGAELWGSSPICGSTEPKLIAVKAPYFPGSAAECRLEAEAPSVLSSELGFGSIIARKKDLRPGLRALIAEAAFEM
jgi:hypothetical protein